MSVTLQLGATSQYGSIFTNPFNYPIKINAISFPGVIITGDQTDSAMLNGFNLDKLPATLAPGASITFNFTITTGPVAGGHPGTSGINPLIYNVFYSANGQTGQKLSALAVTVTVVDPCFAAGTRIATEGGEIPVEFLAVGDLVRTRSNGSRPVRWIGRRHVNLLGRGDPDRAQPVRVRAGALGANVPSRDLVVSPDHALLVDERLIPARLLINGRSIAAEDRNGVEYFHVELDRHDILFAEGAPAESYLDTGNRAAFDNGPVIAIYSEPSLAIRARDVEHGACLPLTVDPAIVEPIARRIAARAVLTVGTEANDAGPVQARRA